MGISSLVNEKRLKCFATASPMVRAANSIAVDLTTQHVIIFCA